MRTCDNIAVCRASEFIAALQKIVDEHGDLPLVLHDPDTDWFMAAGLVHCPADDEAEARIEITGEYYGEPDGYVAPSEIPSQEKP